LNEQEAQNYFAVISNRYFYGGSCSGFDYTRDLTIMQHLDY